MCYGISGAGRNGSMTFIILNILHQPRDRDKIGTKLYQQPT